MKTTSLFFSLLLLMLTTNSEAAVDADGLTVVTYVCEVILVADDVPVNEGLWKFQAEVSGGTHGGAPKVFKAGSHEVTVVADATWLGLSWTNAGKKIAEGVFVMGPMDRSMNRVGILYDPRDNGAQASIGCSEGEL